MLMPVIFASLPILPEIPTGEWLIEVESRDSPLLLTADLTESTAQVRRLNWVINGTVAKTGDSTFTITFPGNILLGAGEMTLTASNNTISGRVTTALFRENVRGVPVPKVAIPRSSKPEINGPGFTILDVPAKLTSAKTAGISIARFQGDQVVEEGFYGVDNASTGEPVTANTRFQAGGMGSVLTCLATLKLAGQGKLNLTDTVTSALPGIKIPYKDGKEIRILDLLRGSSGLGQYKFRGYPQTQNPPSLTELLNGADPEQVNPLEIVSPIGEQTAFNGINHALLQAILEKTTGKGFPSLMQDLLLRPLRMTRSTFELRPRSARNARFATGHYETGEALLFGNHIYPMLGDSGLWTTAPDLARAFIQAGRLLAGKSNQILPPNKMDLLALVDGPKGVAGFVRGDPDTYFHGGDTYGQFSNFTLHPKRGTGVVVMTNRVMNWRLVGELIGMADQK